MGIALLEKTFHCLFIKFQACLAVIPLPSPVLCSGPLLCIQATYRLIRVEVMVPQLQHRSACHKMQAALASLAVFEAGRFLLELPLLTPNQPPRTPKDVQRRKVAEMLRMPSRMQQMVPVV